tara:strand:- start:280 stop:747 length:468 start_codon:yes stop_codon:yes gene_type:complete
MDINLTIDNFLDTLLSDDVKNVNGVDEIVPSTEKTNLGMCFYQSLKNRVLPAEFEENISKGSIRINPVGKPEITEHIGSDLWKDGWLIMEHSLDDKQILHLIVIYRLSYLQHIYPDKFDKIKDIPSSKNLNEYFSKSKEELQNEYYKVNVEEGAN